MGHGVTWKPAGSLGRPRGTGSLLACRFIFRPLQSADSLDVPLLLTAGWLSAWSRPRLASNASDCGRQLLHVSVALL